MKRIESILVRKEETSLNVFKLKAMVRGKEAPAILMYGSPDPDAVASAMALEEILRQTSGIARCAMISTEPVARQQNREFIRAMRLDIQLLDRIDIGSFDLIALVDAQPTFFGQALDNFRIRPQIVLDHHPAAGVWHAELADIRPNYGALSTVMMEYLLTAKVRIPRKLYTALLYGIKTDTNSFERDSILEDITAYYLAYSRANRQLIRRIELNQIPEKYFKYFDYAFHHRRRYRDRVMCFLGKVESADACVQVADFFIRIAEVFYVLIAGIVRDRLVIVLRGDGYRQDCGAIAIKAFGGYGSAGGHKSAARVEIPVETLKAPLNDDYSQENVEQFMIQCLRRARKRGRPAEPPPAQNS